MPERSETGTRTDKTRLASASPFIDPESSLTGQFNLPTLPLLEPARRSIQNHSLLKTPQQRCNGEIQAALTAFPDVLVNMVIDYASVDPCFEPFSLDNYGNVIITEACRPVLDSLFAAFTASHSRSALMRKEIIQHHTRALLDPIFKDMYAPQENRRQLNLILSGDSQAKMDRKKQLLAAARYLPASTFDQLIRDELAYIKEWQDAPHLSSGRTETQIAEFERRHLNLQLFIDILRHEAGTAPVTLAKPPDGYQLDLMLINTDANIINKNYLGAHRELLDAFDFACKSRDKRRAIDIGFQLIDLARLRHAQDIVEVFNFALQIRDLCEHYPADYHLYVDLVLKMDSFAQERSRLDLSAQLYSEALAATKVYTEPCIPARYGAKLIYRCTKLQFISDLHPLSKLTCLLDALNLFHHVHKKNHYCPRQLYGVNIATEPEGSKITDVSLTEFLRCFSLLYRLAARLANNQINLVSTLSAEQRAAFSSLSTLCQSMDQSLSYGLGTTDLRNETDPYVLLKHSGTTMPVDFTRHQLVQMTAECLKNALKIMLDTSKEEICAGSADRKRDGLRLGIPPEGPRQFRRTETHWPPFMAAFDELVTLYLKHGMFDELSELISKKHTHSYLLIPGFSKKLATWQTSLQEKLSELERSRPTPAKRQKIHAGT